MGCYAIINIKTREVLVTSKSNWIIDELLKTAFNDKNFTKLRIK